MQIKKLLPFVAAVAILAGCRKSDSPASTTQPEGCTVTGSAANGAVVEGTYIIAYNPSTGARAASAKSMSDLGTNILGKHNIDKSAIKA
ncbi:MAG TPA: hypothetical protein VD996_02300, partial [Chitinophagaceae bacterium]|nr:hypothetical protein [Chitinophagaceae bacterium]